MLRQIPGFSSSAGLTAGRRIRLLKALRCEGSGKRASRALVLADGFPLNIRSGVGLLERVPHTDVTTIEVANGGARTCTDPAR